MKEQKPRYDRDGVQMVLRGRDYAADSLGMLSLNIINGLIGQLTYFYTDKVELAAAAVAAVILVVKIIDAFTDIIMGNIIDTTPAGREKYRPWLLKAGVAAGIFLVLLFTVPQGAASLKVVYALVTNFLMTAVLYTAISVPYTAIMVVRTNSQQERSNMGSTRAAAGYISGMFIAMFTIPITNALGGTQSAWIKLGIIMGLVVILAMLICYRNAREDAVIDDKEAPTTESEEQQAIIPLKEAIIKLFKNRYWVIMLFLSLAANVSNGISLSAGAYYCKWIYGNENLTALSGGIKLIPTFIGIALVPVMVKKWGPTRTVRWTQALGIASLVLRIFNPYNFWYNMALGCVTTFASIPIMCLGGVFIAMTIDENERLYGDRLVARSTSAIGFGQKVASGIGSMLVGLCLAIGGYDAAAETALREAGQLASVGTRQAIFTFSIYIPLVIYIITFILIMKFDLEFRKSDK